MLSHSAVACPSTPIPASGINVIELPTAPVEGSTLTFSCNDNIITSLCKGGLWSPDPEMFECQTTGSYITNANHWTNEPIQ